MFSQYYDFATVFSPYIYIKVLSTKLSAPDINFESNVFPAKA